MGSTARSRPRSRGAICRQLGFAAVGFIIGLGSMVAGSSLVKAADDAGVLDFLLSNAPRWMAPSSVSRASARAQRRAAARRFAAASRAVSGRASRTRHAARARVRVAERRAARARRLQIVVARRSPRRVQIAAARAPRMIASKAAVVTHPARAPRPVAVAATPIPSGRRSVCVRVCDGYLFPIAGLTSKSDLPLHRAMCEAACPGAETALFTIAPGLDDLTRSVSLAGNAYASLSQASVYLTRHVPGCSCQKPDDVAAQFPIERDPTLRRGDILVARDGGWVYAGSRGFETMQGSRTLTVSHRRQANVLLGMDLRERQRRAVRRSLRQAQDAAEAMRVITPSL